LEKGIDKNDKKWEKWEVEARNTKKFDFIVYHAFLAYVFGTKNFEEAIKKDPAIFINKIAHFY